MLERIESISKILAAIVVPVLLWWLGTSYNDRQQQMEERRITAENSASRLTTLLKNLSSESLRERQIATKIAEYFAKNNQLPPELIPVLIEISLTDPNRSVSSGAVQSLAAAGDSNKTLAPAIKQALAELPDRVYIHIRDEQQREQAKKLSSVLEQNGFLVPGIERVASGPKRTEVRYFLPEQQAQGAKKISDIVAQTIGEPVVPTQIRGYEGKVNSKQFEIWLAQK
jgi:hypothetical protein